MKKVIRIILIFSILSVVGCDFLRKVAGRPTEEEIKVKAAEIETRRLARLEDSLAQVREMLRQRDSIRQDSLLYVGALNDMGVRMSSIFSFGQPVEALPNHYNIIAGVYRMKETARKQLSGMTARGFSSYPIVFPGGETAVALAGSDTLSVIVKTISSAKEMKLCPAGVWVYVAR